MEIKEILQKPYTNEQRLDFIVKNNHRKGYEIRETEDELQAWGADENDLLEETRANKLDEALAKAYDFEQNGSVEYKNCVFEMSLSNRHNLDNTQEALEKSGETETPWNDKNDELVTLTLEDIQYIRLNLILGRIRELWIVDYPSYKNQILNAKTVEELEAIEIDYARCNS